MKTEIKIIADKKNPPILRDIKTWKIKWCKLATNIIVFVNVFNIINKLKRWKWII